MTFLRWCRWNRLRHDAIGDFARDWIADTERPRAPSLTTLLDYLEDQGAIEAAIEAAKGCYAEWRRFRATRDGVVGSLLP